MFTIIKAIESALWLNLTTKHLHRDSSVRSWGFGLCHSTLGCWIVGGCWVGSGFGCWDDSSGLSYYGARYLTPWLVRWISPDSAGAADGLNLYVYVGNNPLKYMDPTGHAKVTPDDISRIGVYQVKFISRISLDNIFQSFICFRKIK
jgi:RHS repeat-associated protein